MAKDQGKGLPEEETEEITEEIPEVYVRSLFNIRTWTIRRCRRLPYKNLPASPKARP